MAILLDRLTVPFVGLATSKVVDKDPMPVNVKVNGVSSEVEFVVSVIAIFSKGVASKLL